MLKLNTIIETDGTSIWSDGIPRNVKVTKVEIHSLYRDYSNNRKMHCNLDVYFTKKTWNNEKHGLIYTDKKFLKSLKQHLVSQPEFSKCGGGMDYTEQGMQGRNFVSIVCGHKFCQSWLKKFPDTEVIDW